jgi:hypothetical protein
LYRRGERVVFASFGDVKHGTVSKCSKARAHVRFDGANADSLVYADALRSETAADIARRDHEIAMRKWRDGQPMIALARVTRTSSWSSPIENGAEVNRCGSPAEMRAAAAELQALAIWYEAKPSDPGAK